MPDYAARFCNLSPDRKDTTMPLKQGSGRDTVSEKSTAKGNVGARSWTGKGGTGYSVQTDTDRPCLGDRAIRPPSAPAKQRGAQPAVLTWPEKVM
jgi:hypothetical protein